MRISDWSSDVCSSDLCTLFKYQDVLSVLRDPKTFTSTLLNEGLGQFLGGFLLTGMEDSKHKLTRNLLAPAFSPKALLEWRSEEHTSELQSLMRISYAVFCLKKKNV